MSWGRGENLYQIFSDRSTRHWFNHWWYNSKTISSCCPPPFRALQIYMDMWAWFRNVANRVLSASTDGIFCGIKAVACVLKPQPREKTAAHAKAKRLWQLYITLCDRPLINAKVPLAEFVFLGMIQVLFLNPQAVSCIEPFSATWMLWWKSLPSPQSAPAPS